MKKPTSRDVGFSQDLEVASKTKAGFEAR